MWIPPDRRFDRARGIVEPAARSKSQVSASHQSSAQAFLESVPRSSVPGDDQEAGRSPIDPMYEPPILSLAQVGQLRKPANEAVDEGVMVMTGPWMHDDTCRLVHDEENVVLIGNCEGHIGRAEALPSQGARDIDNLAGSNSNGP
jgi:hypothetical protein